MTQVVDTLAAADRLSTEQVATVKAYLTQSKE